MNTRPVEVRGLTRRFGRTSALRPLTLTLTDGEAVAFVGPNGTGKTTALRMLAGLLVPDGGEGRVLGADLFARPRLRLAGLGYVPQRANLHPELTVTETLRLQANLHGLAQPGEAAERAISGLELQSWRDVRAGKLSGGVARRLQLAAALIHEPRLLLLDEPTSGLDVASRTAFWREVERAKAAGCAVVVNTHEAREARLCDREVTFQLQAAL